MYCKQDGLLCGRFAAELVSLYGTYSFRIMMRRSRCTSTARRLCWSIGVSVVACVSLSAQATNDLRVGVRVYVGVGECTRRFRACDDSASIEGVLTRVTPDTLVLQFGPTGTVSLPRMRGQRIFVSRGRSRVRTALTSALLAGYLTYAMSDLTDATSRSTVRWASTMAGGGLVLGALQPRERWRRVASP